MTLKKVMLLEAKKSFCEYRKKGNEQNKNKKYPSLGKIILQLCDYVTHVFIIQHTAVILPLSGFSRRIKSRQERAINSPSPTDGMAPTR